MRTVADLRSHTADLAETLRVATRRYEVASEGLRLALKHATLRAGHDPATATHIATGVATSAAHVATHLDVAAAWLANLDRTLRVLAEFDGVELPQ